MIVAPGATFEATTSAFASGATVGVRIRDSAGNDVLARTTTGVIEDVTVASSAIFRRTFTAPAAQGQFWIVWDDGSSVDIDELDVLFSAAGSVAPSGRDLCALTDVTRLVPGYNAGNDASTDARLAELITEQSRDAMERTGREFTPIVNGSTPLNPRSFDVDYTSARRREIFIGDLATLSSVTVLDALGNTIQAVDLANVVSRPRIREDWEPIASLWFRGDAASPVPLIPGYVVQVSGTWGFPSVPTTVKDAVARLVIFRYLNDVATQGTQFADAANRAEFNLGASLAAAFQALERFYVPILQGTGDFAPVWNAGVAGVDG